MSTLDLSVPTPAGGFREGLRRLMRSRTALAGVLVLTGFLVMALTAPLLFPESTLSVTKADGPPFSPPSLAYPLGTDEDGRSVLALVAWGARVSLLVGLGATAISMSLGTAIGIASGHYRGWIGAALDRVTDWFLVIPFLPLAIVLATVLGPSIWTITAVIGLTAWPGTARLVRAHTLSLSARPYLERSRALGARNTHQMIHHILPNVMPLVLANTTLAISIAILSETTLSFLGLGDPGSISWGSILDQGFQAGAISEGAWWYLGAPGICVVLVVLAFNLIGRSIEAILDPATSDNS